MAADKESLRTEVSELFTQLGAQIQKDKQHTLEEGRPFAIMRWLSGSHDLQKYPPGPAFVPLGRRDTMTMWTGVWNMDKGDWFRTALGAGVLYTIGLTSATSVGVKNGHRLGFWCAVPAALVGLIAGQRTGIYRYLGYTDNGNPSLYPGYKEDNTPYFMKHEVSERHAPTKQFR